MVVEDSVVAGSVVAEGLAKLRGHQARVAGGGEQVFEAGGEFFAAGIFHQEPGADPRCPAGEDPRAEACR